MEKKTLYIIIAVTTLLAVTMFALQKSKKEIIKVNPEFAQYISGYSSGMQSRIDPITIELSNPITKGLNDVELTKLFSFDPHIAGNAIRLTDREIQFTPEKPLEVSKLYTVSFDLEEVAKVKSGFEDFEFQFATFAQKISVHLDGLKNYPNATPEFNRLDGVITTTDYVDQSKLKSTIAAKFKDKLLPIKFDEFNGFNELKFHVDSIERTDDPEVLLVAWTGKNVDSGSEGIEKIPVSALGDYGVTKTVVREQEGDQMVEITFSEPLLAYQNLDGIVTIEGEDHLTYHIEENTILAYLSNRLIGEKVVTISDGIKNASGFRMLKTVNDTLTFEAPKPRVRLHGGGSILPNSQGLIFPFETVALKAIEVRVIRIFEKNVHHFLQVNDLDGEDELSRFGKVVTEKRIELKIDSSDRYLWSKNVLDLSKLMKPEPGAIYRVGIKFTQKDILCDCPVDEDENEDDDNDDVIIDGDSYYSYSDYEPNWNENEWEDYLYSYDDYDSWGNYSDNESNPCEPSYYQGKAVNRNILGSNIGLVFKLDEDKRSHVFVSDMTTTAPMPNTEILFYDYNKELLSRGKTDSQGMVSIKLKKKPFLLMAKNGVQRGYLKLYDSHTNSLSKFEIEGEVVQKGVKGFLYGERDVWRPGDSLYISFILEDPKKTIPLGHPINFKFLNPSDNVITKYTANHDGRGTYVFRTNTDPSAKTGYYSVAVKVGNHKFQKYVRIETVKPNRLKVAFDVDDDQLQDTTSLQVNWLHGAPARGLKARINLRMRTRTTSFLKYPSFVFSSPLRAEFFKDMTVFDDYIDSSGAAKIPTSVNLGNTAPGMMKATFTTHVFEKGGDFSIDVHTMKYSPFETFVGLELPDMKAYDQSLVTGVRHRFNIASVDKKGKKKDGIKTRVKIYRMRRSWWYEENNESVVNYIARTANITVLDTLITTKDGKAYFDYEATRHNHGNYLITVTDLEGNHQTGAMVYFDAPYWKRQHNSGDENAKMLDFSANKKKYVTGETIRLSIPSSENARALISVETSEKVVKKFWAKTIQGETHVEFAATKEMFPNAFVHITLLQPHHTTKNDRPIRMYGVIPITIDEPSTHLHPLIAMKETIRPNSKASINVREQNGHAMTYTLAVVDDGLLDITAFRTPDPWTTIYSQRTLGVKTWDMYDDVIGAYSGSLSNLISVGGDGSGTIRETPKANRFKPMVRFLGPFTVPAGGSKKHQVDIPNYVGSVRVMVVAQNNGAFGSTQKTVTVKQPLMVLATLPRVLGPKEEISLPINVFAMEPTIKDVSISIEGNDFFKISKSSASVHFDGVGDKIVTIPVRVASKVGIAKLKVIVKSGNEQAYQEIELDVRAPNPVISEGEKKQLKPGETWTSPIHFTGIEGTNKTTVEVSSIPPIGLNKRLDYLIQYPHGCVEQTTSSAFPQLYLSSIMDLSKKERAKISSNITKTIKRLRLFQTDDGGLAYWPGEYDASEWGSNYAGHFLLEAEKCGYAVPKQFKEQWINYQQKMAKNFTYNTSYTSNAHTQAYRLYTLALAGEPDLGSMNRMRESSVKDVSAKWRLAAAYQLIGQKEVAKKMTQGLSARVKTERELSGTFASTERDHAMILETLSLMGDRSKAEPVLTELASQLNSDGWMSTQTTAYALLAVTTYYDLRKSNLSMAFSAQIKGSSMNHVRTTSAVHTSHFGEQEIDQNGMYVIKNTGDKTLFVSVSTAGIPLESNQLKKSNGLRMSVIFRGSDNRMINPESLEQGVDFFAEIEITNKNEKLGLKEIALSQIFPSGWEIHNARLYGGGSNTTDYQDIRDDRVYTYFDLYGGETKVFKLRLNAAYIGKYYMPATYVETMYDHLINAGVPGKWVRVVKTKSTKNSTAGAVVDAS